MVLVLILFRGGRFVIVLMLFIVLARSLDISIGFGSARVIASGKVFIVVTGVGIAPDVF